jgi:hypothetical protein
VLALLLALSLSQVSELALQALGLEVPDCQGDCAHSLDTDSCPPGCMSGRCTKVVAAVTPVVTAPHTLPLVEADEPLRVQVPPRGPGGKRLFHPPRA